MNYSLSMAQEQVLQPGEFLAFMGMTIFFHSVRGTTELLTAILPVWAKEIGFKIDGGVLSPKRYSCGTFTASVLRVATQLKALTRRGKMSLRLSTCSCNP